MGWRLCVLFEHKFEMSGDIWVAKGGCGLKKSSWETSGCVQIVIEAMEVDAFSEKCRERWRLSLGGHQLMRRPSRSLRQGYASLYFGLNLNAPLSKASHEN